jgi:hypothetical protein
VVAGVEFGWWWGLVLQPFGMNLRPEAPFRLPFGWYFVDAFLSPQIVDANVGSRRPRGCLAPTSVVQK